MLRVPGAVPVAGVLHRRYRNPVLCFGTRQHVFRLRTDPRGRLCFRKGVAQDSRLAHVVTLFYTGGGPNPSRIFPRFKYS